MPRLPARFAAVILCFAPLFPPSELAARRGAPDRGHPGAGPAHGDQHSSDHRALPGAAVRQLPPRSQPCCLEWEERRRGSCLGLLLDAFMPAGPVLLGLDDTIERRRGKRSAPRGSTVIRYAPRTATSSRPAACAGSA